MTEHPTGSNPDQLVETSAELLRSLHDSLRRARRASEEYLLQFQAEVDVNPDTSALKPQIAKLDGLIRDIQKVERTLVEHEKTSVGAGPADFDLCAARDEIERRLAGLAAAIHAGSDVGGDE